MPGPIDAVILDFDGTVLDTEWSEYVTIRDEFERLGHPYPLEVFRAGVGRGDNRHWTEHLLELTGPLPDLDHIRARRRQLNDELNAATTIRPGVLDLMGRTQKEIDALADEGLTFRLSEAAKARDAAARGKAEDKQLYDRADNGVLIAREEKDALDALLEEIGHAKTKPRPG